MKKKEILSKVLEIVEPILEEEKLELYDLELKEEPAGWFLRVFIDSEKGVDLEICARVSEILDRKLDSISELPEPYTLEVSSPGIERPLKKLADYQKSVGSKIYLKTFQPFIDAHGEKRREFTGRLEEVDEGSLVIKFDNQKIAIPYSSIAAAHLVAEL